jgi:coenzyme F420-0:L-glutamate ligase/coenzyme F420-1:gamma-L-glutamate ligase
MTHEPEPFGIADALTVTPLLGVPEVKQGDSIAALILAARPPHSWHDGDVVVVTSKVISKSEGRIVEADDRDSSIAAETIDVVAERGATRIVRTRQGWVMAAAGVDASNTDPGTVLLLPEDPDVSARRIRAELQQATGLTLGVIITDTAGRAWRNGLVDLAIGAAGLRALDDHRGRHDASGRELAMTVTAIADELAAATELVKGKTAGRPFAHVRGAAAWVTPDDGPGAAPLVRAADEDLFRLGTREAIAQGHREAVALRRTVRAWTDEAVPRSVIEDAVAAAITAPAPHRTTPWGFAWISDDAQRVRLLDRMREQWRTDLEHDGWSEDAITRRTARGDLLRRAPALLIPYVELTAAHSYPDETRARAERDMFVLSTGAAVQNAMVRLAADGWGSAWVSSTLFCPGVVRELLDWPEHKEPMGALAIGRPLDTAPERPYRPVNDFLT